MTAHTKGSAITTWVGRAIRRLEDPALVTGRGRFTADLPATHWVRFVRSPATVTKLPSPSESIFKSRSLPFCATMGRLLVSV